jgi:hypothetical protein
MDVKQGYVRHQHKPFQRKSQQSPPVVEAGGSKKMIVGVVILLSVGLIGGYWVVQHFVNKAKTTPLPVSNVKASIKQEEATKAVTGQNYYRLCIGPFFNRLKMNKKRNELHKVGVDTLIVKTRLKSTKAH